MTTQTIQAKYEAEMRRLDAEYAALDVLWSRVPRWALLSLLAPAAWYGSGWGAAVVALLVVSAVTATRAYLVAVRRSENRFTRQSLERELCEQRRHVADFGSSILRPETFPWKKVIATTAS
jgi:heme exporter protein D